MNVVVDTNVVISAIFWPGESRLCMVLWAKRRFHLAITVQIYDEYTDVAQRIATKIPQVNPQPWLKWIERKSRVFEPAQIGKQRSRDPDDDPFLACALASEAKIIVSRDKDLLALEKPFISGHQSCGRKPIRDQSARSQCLGLNKITFLSVPSTSTLCVSIPGSSLSA